MKVLFDYQAFRMQRFGGVSRCFVELYKNLPDGVEAEISVTESDNVYLKEIMPQVDPVGTKYRNFICKRDFFGKGHLFLWADRFRRDKCCPDYSRNMMIKRLKRHDYDIFHPTYFDDYFLPYLDGTPFVLTIHDMIPELYPQYFRRDDFQIVKRRILAPKASAIITVSEQTKRDVVDILGVDERKVHVIYHGCSFPTDIKTETKYTGSPYILYVGQRNAYKDFDIFMAQCAAFLRHHEEVDIVCTGCAFSEEETAMMEALGLRNRFRHEWVDGNERMYALYHNALCFVYPSEYEGFGIPILEAYAADCPVVLNRASCFPEIAADAALFFSFKENEETASTSTVGSLDAALERVYGMNDTERTSLIKRQQIRLEKFSWQRSALQLAEVYQSVLRERMMN